MDIRILNRARIVLTLPQTAPEGTSNEGHSRAAIGQSEGGAHSRALATHRVAPPGTYIPTVSGHQGSLSPETALASLELNC